MGLERILGVLLIGARRGEEFLLCLCARLVVEVFKLKDEPERLPNRNCGLEVDRLSGLTLPARLDS